MFQQSIIFARIRNILRNIIIQHISRQKLLIHRHLLVVIHYLIIVFIICSQVHICSHGNHIIIRKNRCIKTRNQQIYFRNLQFRIQVMHSRKSLIEFTLYLFYIRKLFSDLLIGLCKSHSGISQKISIQPTQFCRVFCIQPKYSFYIYRHKLLIISVQLLNIRFSTIWTNTQQCTIKAHHFYVHHLHVLRKKLPSSLASAQQNCQ